MSKIANIKAFEILDSRGNPTVKAEVTLDNGISSIAAVPSGASKGTHEACELRDNDPDRFLGMGVLKSIKAIENAIAPKLKGLDPANQKNIDGLMIDLDGTDNKSKLGANSILAVSLACARVAAKSNNSNLYVYIAKLLDKKNSFKLPTPMFNVINGGLHGCGKFNFQEFLLIPKSGTPFDSCLRMASEIYQNLKKSLKAKNFIYSVGDEGGFTPEFNSNEEVIEFILETINKTNYSYGKDVFLGIDFASSSYYQKDGYILVKTGKKFSKKEYMDYLIGFANKYHLLTLEDPLGEDDWDGWTYLSNKIGKNTVIIGDDLLVTSQKRLEKSIKMKACSGIIIKPNQIGTLTETLEVIKLAEISGIKTVISHRSGETNDDFIADLAVGVGADFAKFGAPARGERVIKYNKLLWLYLKISNKL